MPVDDLIEKSRQGLRELHKERRWEIHTSHGLRHYPHEKLEDAIAAHLADYGHPAGEPCPLGTYVEWVDGEQAHTPKPIKPYLDSLAELAAKKSEINMEFPK